MRTLPLLLAATALAGCSMQPKYVRGELPVPPSWPVGDAYLRQSEAALPAINYRDIFRDRRLQQLIDQALVNNRDLRAAAANIVAARAQYRVQRSSLFPTVTAGAGANFREGSVNVPGGTTARTTFIDNYSVDAGFSAFEIDLFGRVRSLTDAALNRYFAQEAAARSVRLALVADIAAAWAAYAADRSLLTLAEQTVANAGQSVRLTRARLQGGIAPRTDLRQAELVLEQAQSDLAEQTTALAQDVNALQLLVGAPIDTTFLPASIEQAAPTLAELPAGLDSSILLRRPDVVQAEYLLRAANADIGAARAELFPRISLTSALGFASGALGSLFNGRAFSWSASPNVDYPIFRAGAGRAGVDQAKAQRDAALAQYQGAIQTAFREVSDALARRGTIDAQEGAQQRLVAASQDNYRLSDARYRGGIDTFLQNLDAQRSLYSAQRSLIGTRLIRANNLVTLYRTLGGDNQLDASAGAPKDVSRP